MKEKRRVQSSYLSYTGIWHWTDYDLSADLDGYEFL